MENNLLSGSAGKRGSSVRSDCYIEITKNKKKGIKLNLTSKVEIMYGDNIRTLLHELSNFFKLENVDILVEDYGALPFVMAARFEAAVNVLFPENTLQYLPEFNKKNKYSTSKEKFRRSRLYLPGNEPKFFLNAGLHKPDGIILDLEDSVAYSEKDAARIMVRNSLRAVDFYNTERMVRINQLPLGIKDIHAIVPHNVHVILIPKVENAEQIKLVEKEVNQVKEQFNIKDDIYFMPIIETAAGVLNAQSIAASSSSICSLAIGLEDYTADLGTQRTLEGKESFFARSMVVNAAKAAGIQAIDTVFSDVADMEGLRLSVIEAKALGFEGKGCIHPRQIPVVHQAFAPSPEEIDKAKKIVDAFNEAEKQGIGVVSLGSKMIDAPVVKRAKTVLKLVENLQ